MQNNKDLVITTEQKYGSLYKQHILEQYKLYVEMADRISQRRMVANTFYTTITSIMLTVYGIVYALYPIATIFIAVIGIVISISWYQMVLKYRNLNSIKFHIINDIEDELPLSPYKYEYIKCINDKKHSPLTNIEKHLPVCVGGIFLLLFILNIIKYL